MTDEMIGDRSQLLAPPKDIYSDLVYLMDKEYKEVVRQYHAIRLDKHIVSAYSINGRHCLVLFVDGQVKKTNKKTKLIKKGL